MPNQFSTKSRRGAVAVVVRENRLLVIRRSQSVEAPGAYCFPGGGIEAGETEQEALCREIQEELSATIRPLRRLWRSITSWGVDLAWWLAELKADEQLVPDPAEVESILWVTIEQMAQLPRLLESNRQFLNALAGREFDLDGIDLDLPGK